MAGTKEGGLKAKAINLANNPNHYSEMGVLGGKAKVPKGFASDRKRARESGSIGGKNGRPTPKNYILIDGQKVAVVDYARKNGLNYSSVLQRAKKNGELV